MKTNDQQRTLLTSQRTTEWYTPAWIAQLAHDIMGRIELDPASNAIANTVINAERYYDDDGLTLPWTTPALFLNPPYNGAAAHWCEKATTHYETGEIEQGILLVYAKLGYEWFERLWNTYPTCFLRKRVTFWNPTRTTAQQAKHGSALVYLGSSYETFDTHTRPYGRVVLPEESEQRFLEERFSEETILLDQIVNE